MPIAAKHMQIRISLVIYGFEKQGGNSNDL